MTNKTQYIRKIDKLGYERNFSTEKPYKELDRRKMKHGYVCGMDVGRVCCRLTSRAI